MYAFIGVACLAVTSLLTGPTPSTLDPTENTFAPQFVNDTNATATVDYCNRGAACAPTIWTERLRPGQSASDNISSGPGDLSVFVVKTTGHPRCIRLER